MKNKVAYLIVAVLVSITAFSIVTTPADRFDEGITVTISADWVETYNSVEQMTEAADLIVVGEIGKGATWEYPIKYRYAPLVFTNYTVAIESVLKGETDKEIVVWVDGGIVESIEYVLDDSPLLVEGSEMVLFLRKTGNTWTTLGGPQGRFTVVKGKVYATEEETVNDLTGHLKTDGQDLNSFTKDIS